MERTCFDILAELFAGDVDRDLMAQALARTPDERLLWLEDMQSLAEELREGAREAEAVTRPPE